MRLLIVEDSPIVRTRLVALLDELPTVDVVGEAGDTAGARDLLSRLSPDAVILDLALPDGNGLEVLREIRGRATPALVIVFTNHFGDHYRTRCLEGGADFFFDKSKDLSRLLDVLRERTAAG